MKLEKLRNIEKTVKEILENDKLAREDDCYLILEVIRKYFPFEVGKTFASVMTEGKSRGICFESITRARRKLQRKYPELVNEEVAEIRDAEQEEYKKYSREK